MVNKNCMEKVAKIWMKDKKNYVKITTMNSYRLIVLNHINPYFGEKEDCTEGEVQEFVLTKLDKGLSQKSVRDILVVLKMIIRFGTKLGSFTKKDMDIVFPVNTKREKLDVLTKDEQKKIFLHIDDNFNFQNLGIIICLSTGIRIGELCGLKWSDINVESGTVSISRTVQRTYNKENDIRTEIIIDSPKTCNSNREIPLSNKLMKILKPLMRIVNEKFFILTNSKHPTEPRTYRNFFIKFLEELEIRRMRFHSLRHTFATRCIESGGDYKTISVILGHSNISTTLNLYVHPNNDQKKKCIEKMLKSFDEKCRSNGIICQSS